MKELRKRLSDRPERKRRGMTTLPFRGGMRSAKEERFLSARADAFAGANAEEKVGPLRSK